MTVITEDAIRELASFRGEEAPVITCYLDVDGRRFARRHEYEIALESMLKTARTKANGSVSVAQDLRRIEDYVKGGIDRSSTRGLAFFACGAHDLWRVVPLPVPVHNRLLINSAPAVGQLESVVQHYDRFGVLLVDSQRARMFVFELGELTDYTELIDELPRDYDVHGRSDRGLDRAQHHVDELRVQHLRRAAHAAFELFQQQPFEHLTIAAPEGIGHEMEGYLHPYLRERLCGRLSLAVNAGADEIREAALRLEAEVERRIEAEAVAKLRDTLGAGGLACAGLEPVLRALHERRVERLLVSFGYVEAGWHCNTCGALATVGRTCPVCSAPDMQQLEDVVEEAVEMALSQGVRVSMCVGNADLDVLGRVGALLRY